jgi:hypothetical protein
MWIGQPAPTHSSWFVHPGQTPLLPAARVKDDRDNDASIIWMWHVRIWHVTFTGKTLNGAPVDMAIDNAPVVWHSGHTEIVNSGRRLAPGDVRGPTFGIAHLLDAFGGRHLSCCRKLCQSNHWRPRLPAGDQGIPITKVT